MLKHCARRVLPAMWLLCWSAVSPFGTSQLTANEAPCKTTEAPSKNALRVEQKALEDKLRAKLSEMENLDSAGDAVERGQALAHDIEEIRLSLAEMSFDLACRRTDWEHATVLRGAAQLVQITTFYATNRAATGSPEPGDFYGYDLHDSLKFGKVAVTVPNDHRIGELELPTLWKLELTPDPSKHFVLKEVAPLETNSALAEIGAAIEKSRRKALLLFVHGFRVSFEEAALRSAQLSLDLRFPGAVMFFSWPSTGTARGYPHDEEAAILSENAFNELLERVSGLPVDDIYILAHSMGNRIVATTLADRARQGLSTEKVRALLLAAPDINAKVFVTKIAPGLRQFDRMSKTIYSSSNDVALAASKWVHEFPRVGETLGGVQSYEGFHNVDASYAAPRRRSWGHSYVFDSGSVIEDIEDVIVWQRPLEERRLERMGSVSAPYWRLVPKGTSQSPAP